MRDVLPDEIPLWRRLEETARRLAELRGYREIRPVLLEETSLFTRSVGEVTDIVEKEMFTLEKGDGSLSLRPEGTAGIVRAYLEAGWAKTDPVQKLFHVGPMFRYERPQKGRERMFTQFDVEAIGSHDPRLDAEVIALAVRFFEELGLSGLEVRINSMGDGEDRDRFRAAVREKLAPYRARLCPDCQARFERSVLRILDCKNPACREILKDSGARDLQMLTFLSPGNEADFMQVVGLLKDLRIDYTVDSLLVRGLDYYTRTVFEVHDPSLGARSALCGGGRYDHLVEELGGPSLGAVGFAIGFSSTRIALEERRLAGVIAVEPLDVYVVAIDDHGIRDALRLSETLREEEISTLFDTSGRSVKSQMKQAVARARLAVVIGADEAERGTVQLKDLASNEQREVARKDLVAEVRAALGRDSAAHSGS